MLLDKTYLKGGNFYNFSYCLLSIYNKNKSSFTKYSKLYNKEPSYDNKKQGNTHTHTKNKNNNNRIKKNLQTYITLLTYH